MELLFLQPIFKERIWGGNKLKTDFAYPIPSNKTGECWAISAHKNGETIIRNGQHAGVALSQLWAQQAELFATDTKRPFPLMVKILDANTDLSVQVHPNDKFAQAVEQDLGKAECWYVLAATADAQIIYGHTAKSQAEFIRQANQGNWAQLLTSVKVQAGDFFDVPTGTVHALGAGTLILEIQQSSDTTYRLYDYNRKDERGNLRELHLEKAYQVINAPHLLNKAKADKKLIGTNSYLHTLTHNPHFQVAKLELNGAATLTASAPYFLVSVVTGKATLNGFTISKGDHFIVPHAMRKLKFDGYATLIIANEAPTLAPAARLSR